MALESDLEKILSHDKSCRTDCIYELNAHERHNNVIITTGEFGIFFKQRSVRFGGVSMRNMVECNDIPR